MLSTRTTSALAASALALTLFLTGCGGSETAGTTPENTGGSSAPTSTEPSAAPSSAGGDTEGAKPTRDEVVEGMVAYFKEMGAGAGSEDILRDLSECTVDAMYDKASEKTLKAMADGELTSIDPADAELFSTATTDCTTKVTG